eukprot:11592756-Ditylum_brightwellii.AAC.1
MSTADNKRKSPVMLSTVITPQIDKEITKPADTNPTTINTPLVFPSALHHTTPIASQHSNSTPTGAMITCNINSELPLSENEHTQ